MVSRSVWVRHTLTPPPPPGVFVYLGRSCLFFHTANILLFPDCGLNKNDFAESWFALTAWAPSLSLSSSRTRSERQLWPRGAATAFPQCSTDDHTLRPQPHVNSGGQIKVGPWQRSSWEDRDSWDNKKWTKLHAGTPDPGYFVSKHRWLYFIDSMD